MSTTSVAGHYLAQLASHGIEHLYINAGTDFAPLAEAYAANATGSNTQLPEPVLCAHEGLAVGMAHGAYLASGRPQAVMFHVSVGTANAICAVANAARDNVPLLVTAGRTPLLETGMTGSRDAMIHWAQEMFDQAGMLREFVKWDYEMKNPLQVDQVVDRAMGVARSVPAGPVYLTLPREVLAQDMPDGYTEVPRTAVPQPGDPERGAVSALAERLAAATFPLIVTSASGADRDAVGLLGEIASEFAIGVADVTPRYLNLPFDHEMHLGMTRPSLYADADVILYLECDVPWISAHMAPRDDAFIAQAGIDPLFARYPMRSHRSDVTISGKPSAILRMLKDALGRMDTGAAQSRRDHLREKAAGVHAKLSTDQEPDVAADAPIAKAFMSEVLGQALDDNITVFNEYWGSPAHLRRQKPGTYFFLPPAGGLGWALPAALGASHNSGKPSVALVGDGAYMFANPAACHHAAVATTCRC